MDGSCNFNQIEIEYRQCHGAAEVLLCCRNIIRYQVPTQSDYFSSDVISDDMIYFLSNNVSASSAIFALKG